MIKSGEHFISGRVVNRGTGGGVAGLLVQAWDKDMFSDDPLGEVTTGTEGQFELRFGEEAVRDVFEKRPDIYFRVYRNSELVASTEDAVRWDVEGPLTGVTIEADLPVPPAEEGEGDDGPPAVEGESDGDSETFETPVEIPWRLASASQFGGGQDDPDDVTLSLFVYEPRQESLERDYPQWRPVYLRLAVSVSPLQVGAEALGDFAARYLGGGLPVRHLRLDLAVRPPKPGLRPGPYFHAAAPLERRMLQTGVLGAEVYEGAAEGLSYGKSATQLHESVRSTTRTRRGGGGLSLNLGVVKLGGSGGGTSTTVDTERSVDQVVDTLHREASQERRELVSHSTRIDNVLTLLTAKHLGSPYLTFTLMPRPLQALSVDPSDPNRWYHQLLEERSRGIEGIQDFFAVVMVPRAQEAFTVEARLRRLGVLDVAPSAPAYKAREEVALEYLHRVYPEGTPLDELDVDLDFDRDQYPRPVVRGWWVAGPASPMYVHRSIYLWFQALPVGGHEKQGSSAYKMVSEVALDAYEDALALSPLERGEVVGQDLALVTELLWHSNRWQAGGVARRGSGIGQLAFAPGVPPLAAFLRRRRALDADAYRHLHTVGTWNLLEHQLAGEVANHPLAALPPMAPESPGIVRLLLERWADLNADDVGNLPLAEAARALALTPSQRRALSQAGIQDLRGLARLLRSEPEGRTRSEELRRLAESLPAAEAERIAVPPAASLAPEVLKRIETRIAGALRRPAP